MFAQLGTMGVTLLFSSGDDGVGGELCRLNDGTNRVKFYPGLPCIV
jgi:tripeptidyl-peptidase-1